MRLLGWELISEIRMMFLVHRRTTLLLFVVPMLYTLFFAGLFYKNSLTGVPVVICNLDDGECGQQLVHNFYDTPELWVQEVEGNAADTEHLFALSEAGGVVIIPKDFSQRIKSGNSATVELVTDNGNTVVGGSVLRAVQAAVDTYGAEATVQSRLAAGWSEAAATGAQLTVSSRILYNPTGGYTDFFLAALILHAGQIGTVFLLGPALVLEKRFRKRELIRCPCVILITKLFLYTLAETSAMAMCFAIGIGCFGMKCLGSGGEILGLTSAYVACVVSFALCVGAWVSVPYRAITYSLFYIMPSVLFSGAIWPRSSMDGVSFVLSYLLPIGYAANDLRSLLVKGAAPDWPLHAATLVSVGAVFWFLAVWGIKKQREVTEHDRNHAPRTKAAAS